MNDDLTVRLKCDVELDVPGPTMPVVDKWAADALRALADRLEKGQFQDGFADVPDKVGKKIGTVYVDYSEEDVS
jgi:hypothetical protein